MTFLTEKFGGNKQGSCFPFIPGGHGAPREQEFSFAPLHHQNLLARLFGSAFPRVYAGLILGFSLQGCLALTQAMLPHLAFIRN